MSTPFQVIGVYASWLGIVGRAEELIDDWRKAIDRMTSVGGRKGLALWGGEPHLHNGLSDDELRERVEYMQAAGIDTITSIVAMVWGNSPMGDEAAVTAYLKEIRNACDLAERLTALGVIPEDFELPIRADSATNLDGDGEKADLIKTLNKAIAICREYHCVLAIEPEACWKHMNTLADIKELLEACPGLKIQFDYSHMWHVLNGTNAPEGTVLPESMEDLIDQIGVENIGDVHVAQTDGTLRGGEGHDQTGAHSWLHAEDGKVDVIAVTRYLYENGYRGDLTWDGCMLPDFDDLDEHAKNVIVLDQAVAAANDVLAPAA